MLDLHATPFCTVKIEKLKSICNKNAWILKQHLVKALYVWVMIENKLKLT